MPTSRIDRTKAEMRPSSPRSSRISSTTARYSRSSSRVFTPGGSSSGRSCTSTRSRPWESVWAAPAIPRCKPTRLTAPTPPGRRTRSATSATVPTFAYSPSCRGTSRMRSSSPTSAEIVTFMFGKTTMSSSGTSSSVLKLHHPSVLATRSIVASTNEVQRWERSYGSGKNGRQPRRTVMRKLICSMRVSLDGFTAGPDGEIDWSAPDEELHRFHNQQAREAGAHLYGRRLYETMRYWETAEEDPSATESMLEFARIWKDTPKIVFS